jgi:hypothetical protein
MSRVALALLAVLALSGSGYSRPVAPSQQPTFASLVASLSEPGGYFDTDNLISNERSYLHVIPDLAEGRVRGGAYVGVGPDQNFSYIAHVRPAIAFIIDIRRDNLLLHLLFKTLFTLARTRIEYLALLTGRAPPEPIAGWESRPIEAIVTFIERAPALAPAPLGALRTRLGTKLATFGVPLSATDRQTIDRFHQRFISAGLSLQFNSTGRAPQYDYPTYRDLLLEVDRAGQRRNFLVSEESFQAVKSLQERDLVVPVVGNLSGPSALASIGRHLSTTGERLSAFYASNVEFYLFRDGSFAQFVSNLRRLPHTDNAVLIRSAFGAYGAARPGYNSASLTQPIKTLLDGFAKGEFRQYWELTRPR